MSLAIPRWYATADTYSFTVMLLASLQGTDLNGRQYTITVGAKDLASSGRNRMGKFVRIHNLDFVSEFKPICVAITAFLHWMELASCG